MRPFRLKYSSSSGSGYTLGSNPSSSTLGGTRSTTTNTSTTNTNANASPTNGTVIEKTKNKLTHLRNNPSQPTFFAKALRSDVQHHHPITSSTANSSLYETPPQDLISLPFRLNVSSLHDKTRRNVPYLRHSWSRIDFVAVVSFWICFGLACFGVERGGGGAGYHVGVFRAMSVLRTARLLAISSGTTVSPFLSFWGLC